MLTRLGWGPYDEDHPAARVRTCGHVFGRDCLPDITKGPTGDLCPICRSPWFRTDTLPLMLQFLNRFFVNPLVNLLTPIRLTLYKIEAKLPPWALSIGRFLFYAGNVYHQIDYMIRALTGLYARNPGLRSFTMSPVIRHEKWDRFLILTCSYLATRTTKPTAINIGAATLSLHEEVLVCAVTSIMFKVYILLKHGAHRQLKSRRDCAIFGLITGLILTLHWLAASMVFKIVIKNHQQAGNRRVENLEVGRDL